MDTPNTCGDCGRSFDDKANALSIFDTSVCLGCRAFRCDTCGELFTDARNVDAIASTDKCRACLEVDEMAQTY